MVEFISIQCCSLCWWGNHLQYQILVSSVLVLFIYVGKFGLIGVIVSLLQEVL